MTWDPSTANSPSDDVADIDETIYLQRFLQSFGGYAGIFRKALPFASANRASSLGVAVLSLDMPDWKPYTYDLEAHVLDLKLAEMAGDAAKSHSAVSSRAVGRDELTRPGGTFW
ncbi:hypothetical protein [Taklimakanibacter deserti]|uniref:hypothetical protein n=1 Tax=Taklimakanibacter deserti TaxID=2267839 RepID=UPI0013C40CFA